MIDQPNGEHLTPEQERARDSVRGLGQVRAGNEFRHRLHQQFVSGELAEQGSQRPVSGSSRRRSVVKRFGWMLAPAAAVFLVAIVAFLNHPPQWIVTPLSDEGYVLVDGQRVDMSQINSLPDVARAGSGIETAEGARFELQLPGVLIVEVTTGSSLTMLNTPGRWFGRTVRNHINNGEVRFLAGPGFTGDQLEITTPDGRILVTGTIVAVNCDDTGTCVCVMDGTALVGTGPADMEEVPSGMRKVMPRNDKPFITEIEPTHREGILDFGARHPDMEKQHD